MPTFTPPSTEYSYPSRERLWQFFRSAAHGMSLIRWLDGTYSLVETVTTDEFDEASIIYLGGHVYVVSDDEATALTAAGYGDGLTSDASPGVPGTPAPPYDPPPGSGGGGGGGGGSPAPDSGFGSTGFGSSGFGD